MRPSDNINELIKKLQLKASAELDKRVHDDISAALIKPQKTKSVQPEPNLWRTIMKSKTIRFTAAAVIMIACVIGWSLWRGTQSGIVLADVLARVEQVKAFRCQWSEKTTGGDPNNPYSYETRGTFLISQEYGWKTIFEELDPNGGKSTSELYRLPDKKTIISILHKQKKYSREEFDARWAEEFWKSANDPRTVTKRILECKHESLDRSTIDGIEVEGFQSNDPNCLGYRKGKVEVVVKMWADVKTRLPVRYEFTTAYYDQMGDKIIERDNFVMHDFQWNVPVDAAECVPVIPDDYTGTLVKFPDHITEEIAIQGLKLGVELLGNYPDPERFRNFSTVLQSALEKSETFAAMRLKEELKGLSEDDKTQRLSDATLPIRCLVRFYIALQWDKKDPAYYGKTVTPKDADKVLMRWKISENEYRVIFGDLSTLDVSPEKLAELEELPPQ